MFGTFRDKLKESGTSYQGGAEEKLDAKTVAIHDTKASLLGLPDPGFAAYLALTCCAWPLVWWALTSQHSVHLWSPHTLALLASGGPVLLAQAMANLTEAGRRPLLYPFHKEGWRASSGHLVISVLVTVAPVYVLVHMLLSQPGQGAYFWLRGGI